MKLHVTVGQTDYTTQIFIQDSSSSTGAGLAGLQAADLTAYYSRVETDNDVTAAALSLSDLSALTDAHSDGGILEIDATNMPGWYRLDLPDAVLASGAWSAGVSIIDSGSNDVAPLAMEIQLVAFNPLDAVRLGLTALPAVAATLVTGSVQTNGGNTASSFETDLTETEDDHWVWAWMEITSGALTGQRRRVVSYDGTSKVIETQAFTDVPADAVTFKLI